MATRVGQAPRDCACDDAGVTVFDQLLDVQVLDIRLQQLRHRRSSLPEIAALHTNAEAANSLAATRADVDSAIGDLVRRQHLLEDEIAQVVAKAEGHEANLYSGSVTNPRELQALQDDSEALRRRQRELEDRDLELMEELEPLNARLDELAVAASALDAEAAGLRESAAQATSEIDAEVADVESQRNTLVASVEPGLLAEYDQLRQQLGGVAIARLEGNVCGGCHLSLSAAEVDRIRKLGPDERVLCEECGRLLVR